MRHLLLTTALLIIVLCGLASKGQAQSCVISGIISDHTSGEVVIGASVALVDDTISRRAVRGAVTNKFGFYAISQVSPGNYFLTVKALAHRRLVRPIVIVPTQSSLRLDLELETEYVTSDVIVVESDSDRGGDHAISTTTVRPDFIQKLPALGGEVDVLRALQLLPGVQSISEISSGLYVRGGSPDQNLYLLDGAIIYNPSHLGGFLSTFNADALNDIRLIKGAFPAEYGGRLSSVLDLTTREGSREHLHGSAGLSLIDGRLNIEGPIGSDASYMFSGRRMYLDLLLLAAPDPSIVPTYYFYDLNGKLTFRLSGSDKLSISGYLGRDVFGAPPSVQDSGNFAVSWGNSTGNLRWTHIATPNLFTNFSAIFTDYHFSTLVQFPHDTSSDFKSSSGIRDYMIRAEAEYLMNDEHHFKAGIEATEHRFRADATAQLSQFASIDRTPTIINAFDGSIYGQDEWKWGNSFKGNAGLRLYYFQGGGYFRAEPRLSMKYALDENVSLTAAFSIADQFLHLIVRNDISLPTDVWFPSTQTIKPEAAQQGVLGLETSILGQDYFVSVEGYYKSMQHLYEYKDTATFSLDVPLENSFTEGTGVAYGVEFFLNKRAGPLTGWIGYTLAWTRRTFPELNNGKPFYPRYDRRHDISVVLAYKLNERWEFGATWTYGTGQAVTVPTNQYYFQPVNPIDYFQYYTNNSTLGYGERNNYRLPAFHKLDISATHSFTWFGLPWKLMLDVYNVYSRQNVFLQNIQRTDTFDNLGNRTSTLQVHRVTLFPIIPTFGLSCAF